MMLKKLIFSIFIILVSFHSYADKLSLKLDKKLSIFSGIGVSSFDVGKSLSQNTTLLSGALDGSASIFEVGAAYKFKRNMFTTFALQGNKLELARVYKLYGTINYQFPTKKLKPYIGVLGGYSYLRWSTPPHQVQLNKQLTSKSYIYGVQVGVEHKLKKRLSIIAKYQYIKFNHSIEIIDNTSHIEHSSEQNLLVGLQYSF